MFKLIEGTKRQPPVYERIYLNGIIRCSAEEVYSTENIRKMVFYTVKYFTVVDIDNYTREQLEGLHTISCGMSELMAAITPADLMTIFPINKTYDGERYQMKDYFSAMEAVNAHGLHEPFKTADKARSLLWEYWNRDIMEYQVKVMSIISAFNQFETGESLLERWIREKDIDLPVCRKYTDQNGKSFIFDENGRSSPLVKNSPKHLKLVQ